MVGRVGRGRDSVVVRHRGHRHRVKWFVEGREMGKVVDRRQVVRGGKNMSHMTQPGRVGGPPVS